MNAVKALILTGYGLNCDYETEFSLSQVGATCHRVHINALIGQGGVGGEARLQDYHVLVFGGGFSWADDHGAGVLMASKLRRHLGASMTRFIEEGKLILGICNGFQTLVNLGLLPGFDGQYGERRAALISNDTGNFIDAWIRLKIHPESPCVFTRGMKTLELPVRHGEGKFYAADGDLKRLFSNHQVVFQYADEHNNEARGQWPQNPNGSLRDIAGICDQSGRILGLMPHPEAYHHVTNHPDWCRKKEERARRSMGALPEEGDGIRIFRNAVDYVRETF